MNRGKRLDIQALRAIAVVSVVIYHLWPNSLTGGFMGVDIFFVISGYLMTTTLMRDAQPVLTAKKKLRATGSFLANFYARRIKRLIPAASITLLATMGLVLLTGNLALIQETVKQIAASALFVQNWFLANNSVDYLANTDPTAVQHFWSLSLEEQFYLVWPILLLVLLLVTVNLHIVYKKTKVTSLAIIPVILLIAGFFAFGYQLTQTQPSLAYFITPARVWELLLGGLIAFLPLLKNYDLRLLLPWIGFAMMGYALYKWDGSNFPGWHALIPTLGTALVIYAGGMAGESKWSFERILRFRPIQWLGDISYSLYLWHWPLIILLPIIFFVDLDTHPRAFLIKIGILVLSLVMAHLSFRYIEQTPQRFKLKKRYVYSSFAAIVALVAGLSYFTHNRIEINMQNAVKEVRAIAINDSDPCTGAKAIFNGCEHSFGSINSNYSQIGNHDKYDYLLNYNTFCSSYDAKRSSKKTIGDFCTVGDVNAKRQITIWGDSHAQHWINPMDKIGREHNIKVNVIGTSSCFGSSQFQENCDIRFGKIKDTDVLDNSEAIIASTWHPGSVKTKGNNSVDVLRVLRTLTDNTNVYLLEDVPISGWQGGPECTALRLTCKNKVEEAVDPIIQDSKDLVDLEVIAADRIISVKDLFCDDTYCYSNIGGVPVYRDRHIHKKTVNSHLTASFAYSTWPALEKKMTDVGILRNTTQNTVGQIPPT